MEHAAVLDLGVSQLPSWLFVLVHLTAIAVAGWLASRAFARGPSVLGAAFVVYGVGEVLYIGYHVGVTTFLLSHTLAEVANLVAFVLAGVAFGLHVAEKRAAPAAA